jgi:anti-repressor protein
MNELIKGAMQTMSSIQISELTNKAHNDVKKDIRRILEECEIDLGKFSHVYKNHQNQDVELYNLPERECMLIVAGYSSKYRLAIIDEWRLLKDNVEVDVRVPKTFREALLLAAEQQDVIEKQSLQIDTMKPKAEFFDQVTGSENCFDMADVAKVCNLGVGRNTLFQFLREVKILRENNTPYQSYIDSGYFRVIESKYSKPDGSVNINLKTVVYQKGINFIIKRYVGRNL